VGREDHVRALLGNRVTSITARRQKLRVDWFTTPAAFRDYFKARYGPVIAAYRSIAGDPDAVSALDDDLADLARRHDQAPRPPPWTGNTSCWPPASEPDWRNNQAQDERLRRIAD
jgi:hypothetical protein